MLSDKQREARRRAVCDYLSEHGPSSLTVAWKQREWLSNQAGTSLVYGPMSRDYRERERIPYIRQGVVDRWKKAPPNRKYILRKREWSGVDGVGFSWFVPAHKGLFSRGVGRRWCYGGWSWFADRMNVWISELPVLWYDEESGCVTPTKPDDSWLDEDADPDDPEYNEVSGGVWRGEDLSSWWELSRQDIAGYLWGDMLIKNL